MEKTENPSLRPESIHRAVYPKEHIHPFAHWRFSKPLTIAAGFETVEKDPVWYTLLQRNGKMKPFKMPFIIDVEASGFGPFSYPIEIGLALGPDERFCTLIKPEAHWEHWDPKAEALHGIDRDTLILNGKPVKTVADQLNKLLGSATVYSDGWVVDKPWVNTLFDTARIRRAFFISPLELILSEPQMEIWHEVKQQVLSKNRFERHRACNDASIIQQTYMETLKLLK